MFSFVTGNIGSSGLLKSNLSKKFLFRLLFIIFVGQCISMGWSYRDSQRSMTADLLEKVSLSGKQLASIAVISRRDFDFTYLGQLIDEMAKDPDISRIIFIDSGITLIDRKKNPKATGPESVGKVDIPVMAGAEKAGNIIIEYNNARILTLIRQQMVINAGLQAVIFAFVSYFVYFFFNRYIGTKVADINRGISGVSSGDLTVRMKRTSDNDEFTVISEGLELLVEWLASTVVKIKTISTSVTGATDHLNKTFKELTSGANRQKISSDNALISIQEALYSLDQVIESTDSLLKLSDKSMQSLNGIHQLSSGVQEKMDRLGKHVNSSYETVRHLSSSSRELSSMAVSASDSMSDAATAVSKINESVGRIGGIVRETTELSVNTTKIIADRGIVSVTEAIDTMQKIDTHVASLSTTIGSLGTRSKDIAKVLDVIKEVTEQTKLLSLNAQILSGQAGESGKPFAVVAAEMKALSEKTAISTREIESIVYALQNEIGTAVTSTKATSEMVLEGKSVAQKANDALSTIQSSSRQSTQMVKTIESVAVDQNRNLEQIAGAFAEIQKLIMQVNLATKQEEEGVNLLFQSFGSIRTAVDDAKTAYSDQTRSIQAISENLAATDEKTRDIADASHRQHEMNEELVRIMKRVIQIGAESLKGVNDVSGRIVAISKELESLNNEMKSFRTG